MSTPSLHTGTVHSNLPNDLKAGIVSKPEALLAWQNTTPLARNEWICWVESAKLIETRARRIGRAQTELAEGKRRPCCWPGCIHRERNRM